LRWEALQVTSKLELRGVFELDKEKLFELIDKLIYRSDRWQEDADEREDYLEMFFYKGQKDMAIEIKTIIEKKF
jgi:hypothetical protein